MNKDDATWVNVLYVVFGAFVAFVVWESFHTLGLELGWAERYDSWYPTATTAGAIVCGLVGAWLLRSKPSRHEYFLSVVAELRKVTWPSYEETKRMTIIVVVVVGIFSAVLAVFDIFWQHAVQLFLT